MTDTVVYYCGGKGPVLELLVSLHSLRKHYNGRVVICLGKTSIKYLKNLINSKEYEILIVPHSENDKSDRDHWKSRWLAMSMIRGSRILHPDCDMVYVKDINPLFDQIHDEDGWVTSFHSVNNGDNKVRWHKHVEEYKKIDPNFSIDEKPFYIEFGIVGWKNYLPYSIEVSNACKILKDDQTAMSYVLMQHGRKAYCPCSVNGNPLMRRARAYYRLKQEQFDKVIAWHCHPAYALWWEAAKEAIKDNFMGLGSSSYFMGINRRYYKQWKNKTYANVVHSCLG